MNQISKGILLQTFSKIHQSLLWQYHGDGFEVPRRYVEINEQNYQMWSLKNHRKICTICAGETLLRFPSLQHWINFRPRFRRTWKTGALTCRMSGRIPWSCLPYSPEKTVAADSDPPLRHRTEGSRGCEGCPSHSSPLSQQVEKVWPQKIKWTGLPRWRLGRESRRWMTDLLRWRRLRCDHRRCQNHTVGWTRRSLLHRKWCCYLRYREGKMLINSVRWEWNRSNCKHSR